MVHGGAPSTTPSNRGVDGASSRTMTKLRPTPAAAHSRRSDAAIPHRGLAHRCAPRSDKSRCAAACASPSWAARISRCRPCARCMPRDMRSPRVYCQPPRPAGRGHAVQRCPVHVAAEALGLAVRTPARLRKRSRRCRRSSPRWPGCRGGRSLRADPAADDAGCAAPRLPQHPCQPAAALARRGADPGGDPGRRRRDRRDHHADGRRAGHRPDAAARGGADRPAGYQRLVARRAGGAGRAADPAGAGGGSAGQCRSRRRARPTRRSSHARTGASTGPAMRRRSNGRCAHSIPGPAPSRRCKARC